jgi:hypothetical protein
VADEVGAGNVSGTGKLGAMLMSIEGACGAEWST